jgi:hypothetical protein
MESSQIKGIFIVVIAAVFAVYLGVAAATAQTEAIAWVAGLMGIAFILAMGKNIWMFIPATLGLIGSINALPGSPPVWSVAAAVTALMYVLRVAMRRSNFVFRLDLVDLAIFLQVVAIGQAWARNPAGMMLLGSDSAGGKSYFVFTAAFIAYFCLAITPATFKQIKIALILTIALMLGDGMIAIVGDWLPSVASAILPIYSNANFSVATSGSADWDLEDERGGGGFSILGRSLVIPLLSLYRPLNCVSPLHPILFALTASGGIMMLLSGFRSGAAYLGAVFVVSALIRRRFIDVAAMGLIGVLALSILTLSGQLRSLPFGVQRILSVLPVDVSAAARVDAENSSEWRFEMWRLALFTDRYIRNKALGDGFGISAREMQAKLDMAFGHSFQNFDIQDQMLATGSYHGFHVETIRFTGVFGLVAALLGMAILFRKALQLVRFYRGREEFPWVAYVCIPFLLYPFWSMLVFGAYRFEFPQFLAMAGLLKMLDTLRLAELASAATPVRKETPAPARGGRLPVPAFGSSAAPPRGA